MDFTHADIAFIYAFITELGFRHAAQRYVMLNVCFLFQILPNNDLLISSIDWMKNMGDYFCRCSNEAGVDEQSTFLYPVSMRICSFIKYNHLIVMRGSRKVYQRVIKL